MQQHRLRNEPPPTEEGQDSTAEKGSIFDRSCEKGHLWLDHAWIGRDRACMRVSLMGCQGKEIGTCIDGVRESRIILSAFPWEIRDGEPLSDENRKVLGRGLCPVSRAR